MEPRQGWRANWYWLERRDEPRREVIRNTRLATQGDAVNKRLRKSVEGKSLAPQVGLEPTTLRLTAECSTIELLRSKAGTSSTLQQTASNAVKLLTTLSNSWRLLN